jgi:hypothetical protein
MTPVGTAQVDTAQKKFGTGALLLDGDSDSLTAPDSADWDFMASTSGGYTIDFWIKENAVDTINQNFMCQDSSLGWFIKKAAKDEVRVFGKDTDVNVTSSATISDGNWHHLAFVRNGSTVTMYVDGTSVGSDTITSAQNYTGLLHIGKLIVSGSPTQYFNGWIDEIRLSTVARYTANFTPKTSAYSSEPVAGGSIKKINGVAWASVSKVSGVSKANISKIIGVDAS